MADGQVVVLDTGPLITLCDKSRASRALAWLQAMRRLGIVGVVPASVATEFLQGTPDPTRAAWWLAQLAGSDLAFSQGRAAGLLARHVPRTRRHLPSPVDAQVVYQAAQLGASVLTTDPLEIRALVDASGRPILVHTLAV